MHISENRTIEVRRSQNLVYNFNSKQSAALSDIHFEKCDIFIELLFWIYNERKADHLA